MRVVLIGARGNVGASLLRALADEPQVDKVDPWPLLRRAFLPAVPTVGGLRFQAVHAAEAADAYRRAIAVVSSIRARRASYTETVLTKLAIKAAPVTTRAAEYGAAVPACCNACRVCTTTNVLGPIVGGGTAAAYAVARLARRLLTRLDDGQ